MTGVLHIDDPGEHYTDLGACFSGVPCVVGDLTGKSMWTNMHNGLLMELHNVFMVMPESRSVVKFNKEGYCKVPA